jgi:phosphopantothenoylcysteine decarboxylase
MPDRVLYLIGCAAPPVRDFSTLIPLVQSQGWQVCVIVTPAAASWVDADALAELTGYPAQSEARHPDETTGLPKADAVLLCPATFNTLNKWAAGISDNVALGVLNEAIGLRLPIWVAPYAKDTLAAHPAFSESLAKLEQWGVTVLANELVRPANKGEHVVWERLVACMDQSPSGQL